EVKEWMTFGHRHGPTSVEVWRCTWRDVIYEHDSAALSWVRKGVSGELRPDSLLDKGNLALAVPVLSIREAELQQTPADELSRRPSVGGHVDLGPRGNIRSVRTATARRTWGIDANTRERGRAANAESTPLGGRPLSASEPPVGTVEVKEILALNVED